MITNIAIAILMLCLSITEIRCIIFFKKKLIKTKKVNINEIRKEIISCKKSLQIIQNIHCEAKDKIELSEHTRELILYILGGRSITLCHTALFLLDSSRLPSFGAIVRLIHETNLAIWYFNKIQDNDKNISRWLDNKNIRAAKLRENMIQISKGVPNVKSEEVKNLLVQVYNDGSKYIHPTFEISKMNLNEHTKVFDYEWFDVINYNISIHYFISQAIIEMLRTFLLPNNIYKIDEQKNQVIIDQISILDALKI